MNNKLNKQDKHIVKELIKNYINYNYLPLKIKDTFLKEVYNNYLEKYKDNLTILIDSSSSILDKEVIKDCLNDDMIYYIDSIKFSQKAIYESKNYKLSFDNMDNLIMLSKIDIKSFYNQNEQVIISTLYHCGLIKSRYYAQDKEDIKDQFNGYCLNKFIKDQRYVNKSITDYCISDYFYCF